MNVLLRALVVVSLAVVILAAREEDHTAAPIPTGLAWTRHGVVLDLADRGGPDDKGLESPTVIRESGGTYLMWYRGVTWADRMGRLMRAESLDGIHWKRSGVVMEPEKSYEGQKIDPMTVFHKDGLYRMWYGAGAMGGNASLATSPDGIHWERHKKNPVLKKTHGQWDNRGAGGQHSVIENGEDYEMIYKGYGSRPSDWTFYGLATSSDGVRWKKRGKRISPEPKLGDSTLFRNLFAFRHGDRIFVIHSMAEHLSLFLQHSDDGKHWQRSGVVFAKGKTPGGWDVKWATSPSLLFEDGRVKMWYEGGDSKGRVRVLYAEVSEGEFFRRALAGPPAPASQ